MRRVYLFAISSLALAACGPGATDPTHALDVSVTLAPDSVRPNEPIMVSVHARNVGGQPLSIGTEPCPEHFFVTNDRGEVVGPRPGICALAGSWRVLSPGEELVIEEVWGGERIGARTSNWIDPGEYSIRGRVLVESGGFVESEPARVRFDF